MNPSKDKTPTTLILENDPVIVTRKIRALLDFKFQQTELDIWLNFGTAFFSRNIEKTKTRFMRLKTGDNIVTKTNLDHFIQMEAVLKLLIKHKALGNKLNVYVDCKPFFAAKVNEYIRLDMSFHSEDKSDQVRREEKKYFDNLIKECILYHSIYQMCDNYHIDETGWQEGLRKVYYDVKEDRCFC